MRRSRSGSEVDARLGFAQEQPSDVAAARLSGRRKHRFATALWRPLASIWTRLCPVPRAPWWRRNDRRALRAGTQRPRAALARASLARRAPWWHASAAGLLPVGMRHPRTAKPLGLPLPLAEGARRSLRAAQARRRRRRRHTPTPTSVAGTPPRRGSWKCVRGALSSIQGLRTRGVWPSNTEPGVRSALSSIQGLRTCGVLPSNTELRLYVAQSQYSHCGRAPHRSPSSERSATFSRFA